MSGYRELVMAAARVDAREAAVVEEIMRVEQPTLDALTRSQFDRLACQSKAALDLLREEDPTTAAFYERQVGVLS